MRFSIVLVLSLVRIAEAGGDTQADVEGAFRRLWEKPGLVLNAGLNNPPPQSRPMVLKALELTAKMAKLEWVHWTPSPSSSAAGPIRGELTAHLAGIMPPSTAPVDFTLLAPDVQLDRATLEQRGGIKLVNPGHFTAVSRIPFDLMAAFNRGSRITASSGQLEVRGHRKVLLFEVPYRLTGPLEVPDRVHMNLRPTSLSMASISAPGAVREALLEAVNPVFCADDAMGPLRYMVTVEIESVAVEPSAVVLHTRGKLRPPGDPDPGPPHHARRAPRPAN